MAVPEDIQQLSVRDLTWIIIDLNRLGVIAEAVVSGVFFCPSAIPDPCPHNALNAPELGIWTPESAKSERGCFRRGGDHGVYGWYRALNGFRFFFRHGQRLPSSKKVG